jgi:chromosome segregation ATPase
LTLQNDTNKKALKQCKYELSKVEDESASTIEHLREEVADLKVECDDLSELVKTKDRMLEDQLQQIQKLKQQLQDKADEMQQADDSKAKYREYYDDKLAQEIEEADRQKSRAEDLQLRLQEAEDELDQLRQD